MFVQFLSSLAIVIGADGFCGDNIKWSHNVNIDDVYGVWYGVGYVQHTPDMTNKPKEIGCVTLYISDATTELQGDWLDWSLLRQNYSDQDWRSYKSNPWSDTPMSGSWLDIRLKRRAKRDIERKWPDIHLKRRAKRDMYSERKLRVIWDEDGQTMEQIYVYTPVSPDVYYPDDPPRHPDVIRVLKVNPHMMIINHCSDSGNGGIFSLILRRSPSKIGRNEWFDLRRQFYNFELPPMHRHSAICAGCSDYASVLLVILSCSLMEMLR